MGFLLCFLLMVGVLNIGNPHEPGSEQQLRSAFELAALMGKQVLREIGWALGLYIPTLIALYAIVVGGQLVSSEERASQTRRTLALVAEVMAASLAPSLLLIVAACFSDPPVAGSMFVIVPAVGVMLFLSVQLGGFLIPEREQLLRAALTAQEWARSKLKSLRRRRSTRSIWVVVPANILASTALAQASLVLVGNVLPWWVPTTIYLATGLYIWVASVPWLYAVEVARDRLTRVGGWIGWHFPIVGASVIVLVSYVVVGHLTGNGLFVGWTIVLTWLIASSVWVADGDRVRGISDWSIGRATARAGAVNALKVLKSSSTEVRALSPTGGARRAGFLANLLEGVRRLRSPAA